MIKPIIHGGWGMHIGEFPVAVEIYCDKAMPTQVNINNNLKILWVNEPKEIFPHLQQHIIVNNHAYDFIFTSDPTLLSLGKSNIKHYMMFHCWNIPFAKECGGIFNKKEFSVSTVVGNKEMLPGHLLRSDLWKRQKEITIPKRFYASSKGKLIDNVDPSMILGDTKYEMFNSQFHIAIENVYRDNMFTEKLNDCIATKTIPIYWGCPNIKNIYDTRGMIIVNDLEDLIDKVNNLTADTYDEMKPYVEENFKIAMALAEVPALHNAILTELNNKI